MSTAPQNISSEKIDSKKREFSNYKIAIIKAEWNANITDKLLEGCKATLLEKGIWENNIKIIEVPGTFELTISSQWLAESKEIDVVIALGCVIQGETPHFTYICEAVAQGLTNVGIKNNKPIVFGVLTTLNEKQAVERAGGNLGNKGSEAAITALKMLLVKKQIS